MIEKEKLNDPVYRKQVFDILLDFFGEPCLPASKYCTALQLYADIKAESNESFAEMWRFLQTDIHKSCLLDRLIYCGEDLRKDKCPTHDGRWSGIDFDGAITCCVGPCGCITGWLPNKEETK